MCPLDAFKELRHPSIWHTKINFWVTSRRREERGGTKQKTEKSLLPPEFSHHILLLFLLLQLCEVGLDPGVAGQQILGGIENLFSLTAGKEQLVGTIPHSYLKVKLFLYVSALFGQNKQERKLKMTKSIYVNSMTGTLH